MEYTAKDVDVAKMEQACDMYEVGDTWDSPKELPQYNPYRPWNVLLEEPGEHDRRGKSAA